MKKTHNERGAGKKPKYNVPVKRILVPILLIGKIEELSKKFGVAKGGIVRELIAYALEHIDSVKETQPT